VTETEERMETARTRVGAGIAALVLLAVTTAYGADAPKAKAAPAAANKAVSAAADTLRALQVAADKDTTNFEKNYRYGVGLLDADRALEAVRAFDRATRAKPKEVKGWVNLGAAYDAIGHGPEARAQYRMALSVNPEDEIALCRLGASLYAGNSRAAALDTLRLTLKRHPKSYCAYFTMGVAFADAQIYQEAIRCWEKVVELAPNSPEAASAKESIATLKELLKPPSSP
jgi:tetratricopeptide (TPR) repeat protein